MSFSLRSVPQPSCLSCVRSMVWHDLARPPRPFLLQIRGKKKRPNRHHMQYVKLLSNITGYGAKGNIIAVPPGLMRNYWYPQGIAQYMTGADLTQIKRNPELLSQRDTEFGKITTQESSPEAAAVDIETQLLSPQRSEALLQTLLPDYIEFFRPVISAAEKSKMQIREAGIEERGAQPKAIFGSVSTQDILQNINEYMTLKGAEAANADAGRVVLQPEDIKLVQSDVKTGVEDDRIKFIGEFEFELHVRGAGVIFRKVRVSAQT